MRGWVGTLGSPSSPQRRGDLFFRLDNLALLYFLICLKFSLLLAQVPFYPCSHAASNIILRLVTQFLPCSINRKLLIATQQRNAIGCDWRWSAAAPPHGLPHHFRGARSQIQWRVGHVARNVWNMQALRDSIQILRL